MYSLRLYKYPDSYALYIYLQYTPSVRYSLHTLFWYRHKHMTFPPPDLCPPPNQLTCSCKHVSSWHSSWRIPYTHHTRMPHNVSQLLCPHRYRRTSTSKYLIIFSIGLFIYRRTNTSKYLFIFSNGLFIYRRTSTSEY